jgi:hypothetical protein
MADVFVYNGDSFLPEYLPGLIGYGQRGADGNNGATGASVHYSSLNVLVYDDSKDSSTEDSSVLSSDMDHINQKIVELILRGKELSNNGYSSRSVEYMVNDIIIERTGRFYIIKLIDKDKEIVEISSIDEYGKSNYSVVTNTFTGFSVYCSTTFLKSDGKKWIQANPSYEPGDYINGVHSPKVYHSEDLSESVFGNFVTFSLSYDTNIDISKYTYKFVLSFPNGQTVEAYSENPHKSVFIDNRYVFGCFDTNGWANSYDFALMNLDKTATGLNVEENSELESSNLIEAYVKMGESMKCRGAVYNEKFNSSISSKGNAVLCSFFIKYNCSAYAEVIDTESGVVYKIDLNDIFISKTGNQISNNRPVIEESLESTNWAVNNYIYNSGEFIMNHPSDPNKSTLFNPMHSYVFMTTFENIDDPNDVRTLSEDGFIENVYYTDASGLAHYTAWGEQFGQPETDELLPSDYGNRGNCFTGADETENNKRGMEDSLRDVVSQIELLKDTPLTVDNLPLTSNTFGTTTHRNKYISSAIRYKYGISPYNKKLDETNADSFKEGAIKPYIDCNRTIKLKFKNVASLTINVVYLKQRGLVHPDTGDSIEYPLTKVYIGYIDHPLIVNNGTDTESPGIYYLTKFVPPGYTGEEDGGDQCSTAGIADLTLNILDFGLNPRDEHTIEIGVTPLDTIKADGTPRDRTEINRMHVSPVTSDNFYASFLNPEACSDSPELKIYVSKIEPISEDYVEDVKEEGEEDEDLNIFNNIRKDLPEV